jgi:hypothetical protein
MIDFVALQMEYYTIKMVPQCNRMLKYYIPHDLFSNDESSAVESLIRL